LGTVAELSDGSLRLESRADEDDVKVEETRTPPGWGHRFRNGRSRRDAHGRARPATHADAPDRALSVQDVSLTTDRQDGAAAPVAVLPYV
jgi:hypothetical protein